MNTPKKETIADPNYRVDWYRTPIDKVKLTELNQRSDLKGFLQSGGFVCLLIVTASLSWWVWKNLAWPWLIPALFLHGTVSAFSINGMHELVHGTVFRTKRLNEIFAGLLAFHYSHNHLAFWASHSEHHKFTLHDPHDQEVVVPMELTLRGFLRTFFFDYAAGSWILRFNFTLARGRCASSWGRYLYGDDPRRFAIFNWSRFVLFGHALILLISLLNGWWLLPVLTSLTPLYGRSLQFLLNETQHVGLQDHVDDFRLNARTFRCNPILRFLYWHMNWHIEHHMYAGVPCYNLHKLHHEVKYELPYVWKNIAEMWFHILSCLYRQKFEPGYVYIPELPGGDRPRDMNENAAVRRQSGGGTASPVQPEISEQGPDGKPWRLWECSVCGFVYDERKGLPEENIAPGTRWDDIPDDWRCPDCGVAKADFEMREVARGTLEATAEGFDVAKENGPVVIVGAGLAGYTLARDYRRLNRMRPLCILCADEGSFYSKPSLSNALSEGRTPETLVMKTREQMAAELDADIIPNCEVIALDREARVLQTSTGEVAYAKLILALGADPIRLPLDGDGVSRVLSVNNLEDYRHFRTSLPEKGKVLIMGAGLVGCEFANDLAAAGHEVWVVDPAERPLARLLPENDSQKLLSALQDVGVRWQFGRTVSGVHAEESGALRVCLDDGVEIGVDMVLSAVGLRPRNELARTAGLECGSGIQVDAFLRCSDPDIFALGDCAEYEGRLRPHVMPITHAAPALARTLVGQETRVDWPVMKVTLKTPACPLSVDQA